MDAITLFCKNMQKINVNYLLKQLFLDTSFKDFIVQQNRDEQLYLLGVDSKGKKLRSEFARFGNVYSNNTILKKKETGQPTDRVTLNETGAFYKTFKVGSDRAIYANTIKEDDDLVKVWGEDILGLTDESLQRVIDLSIEIIIPIILYDALDI